MKKINLLISILVFVVTGLFTMPSLAGRLVHELTTYVPYKEGKDKEPKISLTELEPELIYAFRRYPKFYGDPNTIDGGMFERSYILGDIFCYRTNLIDRGIFLDAGITQFLAQNINGGANHRPFRFNGTADYYFTLDTGKAELWSGGLLMAHGESSWQAGLSINPDVGSLLPAIYDATMPVPQRSYTALSELYFVQALPANFIAIVGKVDFTGLVDQSYFANNERTQFSYTGLVNNPILGAFIPYTPLGAGVVWAPNKKNTLALIALDANGDVRNTGYNTVFNSDAVFGGQYQYSPTFRNLFPGNYRVMAGFSTDEIVDFAIDRRQLIGQITGVVPVAHKSNNYTLLINFDQYIWVADACPTDSDSRFSEFARQNLPPEGVGIFGRAGWAPSDRNVIDQFYSFGIGGYGMIFPNRPYDQWGVGYAATHISSEFKRDVGLLGADLRNFEQGIEAFYNFQVTQAVHLTLNGQIIESPLKSRSAAFTFGSRLQVDL